MRNSLDNKKKEKSPALEGFKVKFRDLVLRSEQNLIEPGGITR
jgi:hypothetical protein